TTLSLTRWSADWESATRLYEQAANGFRVSKDYEKAKLAFEKASKGREMLSSPWDAAKSMESAAALAKELRNWTEVIDFYRKASELYMQCDRPQFASDSLAKAARYGHCFYTIFSGFFHDIFLVILNNIIQPSVFPLYKTGTRVHTMKITS
ncbi:hypothetical protein Gorai_011640, partial [Gossypium raimondii]|nr:hypothetical protein [Gossypium raimondii]